MSVPQTEIQNLPVAQHNTSPTIFAGISNIITNPNQLREVSLGIADAVETGLISSTEFNAQIVQSLGAFAIRLQQTDELLDLGNRQVEDLTAQNEILQAQLGEERGARVQGEDRAAHDNDALQAQLGEERDARVEGEERATQERTAFQQQVNRANDANLDQQEQSARVREGIGMSAIIGSGVTGLFLTIVGNPYVGVPIAVGGVASGFGFMGCPIAQTLRETPRERDIDRFLQTHPDDDLNRDQARERVGNRLSLVRRIKDSADTVDRHRFFRNEANLQAARDLYPNVTDQNLIPWLNRLQNNEDERNRRGDSDCDLAQ